MTAQEKLVRLEAAKKHLEDARVEVDLAMGHTDAGQFTLEGIDDAIMEIEIDISELLDQNG